MLNDMAWRKAPRDLLTNPRIRSIASRIAPELKQAVFAFYVACYMEANDDGIVDLSDDEVFADLILLEKESDVKVLTELFVKKGFLEEIKNGLYYINDWDNPNMATYQGSKRVAETADQRRARVLGASKGGNKNRRKTPQVQVQEYDEQMDVSPAEAFAAAALEAEEADIFLSKNDEKCATNSHFLSRKNGTTEREETRRDESSDRHESVERETHTLSCATATGAPSPSAIASGGAQLQTETETESAVETETQAEEQCSETEEYPENLQSAEEVEQSDNTLLDSKGAQWSFKDTERYAKEMKIPEHVARKFYALSNYENWRCLNVFYHFFRSKCPVDFTKNDLELDTIQLIIVECGLMAETKNPAYVIAGQLCTAFWDLTHQNGSFKGLTYFKNMVCQPKNMKLPSVWPRIVQEAKKRLNPGITAGEMWDKRMAEYADLCEKDREKYNGSNFFEEELKKRGINPHEEGAMKRYIALISAEQREKKRADTA